MHRRVRPTFQCPKLLRDDLCRIEGVVADEPWNAEVDDSLRGRTAPQCPAGERIGDSICGQADPAGLCWASERICDRNLTHAISSPELSSPRHGACGCADHHEFIRRQGSVLLA